MIAPFTWRMELDALDADRALFRHRNPQDGTSTGSLVVARTTWEDLGRPAALEVTATELERARP